MDDYERSKKVVKENNLDEIAYFDYKNEFSDNYSIATVPTIFYLDKDHNIIKTVNNAEDAETIIKNMDKIGE